ncbi:MAG: hypothetical protein FD165_1719 [Gammaproteobacteria bacterium]|nr:MAG: hypothetical protein FD165_1719 [Gammaproteobacteria bacterium]TND04290.1 MAG: hypothetical protein FD120_1404 [Gammaproteobacteria bacterium]
MAWLARHLKKRGFAVHRFPYHSRQASIADHAAQLRQFASALPNDTVHYVAHSLGGRVVWQLLNEYPNRKPGRVVALGTPFLGSRVAGVLAGSGWGRWLLGPGGIDGLLAPVRVGEKPPEIGVIAGISPYGAGRLLCRFDEPSDGTVAVAETRLPGATAHLTIRTTHTGLLLSPAVARNVSGFLATGHFPDAPAGV